MSRKELARAKQLEEALKRLGDDTLVFGYTGPKAMAPHPSRGASVAQVAAWMEYGTPDVPARPFLRTTAALHGDEIRESVVREMRSSFRNLFRTKDQALDAIGQTCVAAVHKTIDAASEWAKPLDKATARRKGHDLPLIDTKTMRDAATYEKRRK